jgi:hypothetical protein
MSSGQYLSHFFSRKFSFDPVFGSVGIMNGAAAFPMAAIPLPRLLHPEVSVRPPVIGTGIPAKAAVFLHSPLTPLPLATTDGAGMTVTVAANLPRVVPMSSGTFQYIN